MTPRPVLLALAMALISIPTRADMIQIDASMDGGFYNTATSNNLGGHTHVPAGVANNGRVNRAVFFMDLDAFLPEGATINSAAFQFDVSLQGGGVDTEFALHRVLTDWDEGSGTGNSGNDNSDGATWNFASGTPATAWSTPGGDFTSADSGQVLVTGPGTFTLGNAQLATDLQAMLDGTTDNFGFLLRAVDEGVNGTAIRIDSRESSGSAARFVIDFTPPFAAGDLDVLLATWGTADTQADADGNGIVGPGDLDIVIGQWGEGTPPANSIPEPGSIAWLALGGSLLLRRGRRPNSQ